MYIYALHNKLNGKYYIGQTVLEPERRFKGHVDNARSGNRMGISRAIRKYGPDAFELQVLCRCSSQEELNAAEVAWIALTAAVKPDVGYNRSAGGRGWGKRSPQQLAEMSERAKGRKPNAAQLAGLAAGWLVGRKNLRPPTSEEAKRRAYNRRGKPLPESVRLAISAAKKSRPMHPNALANLRKGPGSADSAVLSAAQKLRRERERMAIQ